MSTTDELKSALTESGMTVAIRVPISIEDDNRLRIKAKELGLKKTAIISNVINEWLCSQQKGA